MTEPDTAELRRLLGDAARRGVPKIRLYPECVDYPEHLALIVAAVNALPGLLDKLDAQAARIAELERVFPEKTDAAS